MKNIITKYKFLLFLLKIFKDQGYKTKIYIIVRLIIIPMDMLESIEGNLNASSNILDMGCGYGILPLYLHYKHYKNKILGLDIDKERILILQKIVEKKEIKNMEFKTKNFIKEGLNSVNGYDNAILIDILHHLDTETQRKLLVQLSKSIKTIILKDIDIYPRYKYYRNLFHDKIIMKNKIVDVQGSEKLKLMLENVGYKVYYKKINSWLPYPHFLLIAKK